MIEATPETSPNTPSKKRVVYTVIEREGQERGYWVRVGTGWVNRDGSLNVRLNALPVNGQLHIRELDERES